MSEVMTTHDDRRKRRNGARDPALVSASALATHLGCTRQYIALLTAQGVIEKRGDGYDQDHCRLKYVTHLRSEHRRSPRAAADAEHTAAKAALLRMRIEEKRNALVKRDDVNALIDSMVGLLLTHLSGFPARCGGHDLSVRRSIERAVHELRREISEAATAMADQRNEPPLDDQP